MERRRKPRGSTYELAIVRAATWAWYQHGSGSEGKPMREFDVTRTCRAPKPSRYKLEAMRIAAESQEESKSPSPILSPTHTENSLLDAYEIDRISRQLDYLIESSSANFYSRFHVGDRDRRKSGLSPESETSEKKKGRKLLSRFWLRHGVVCGSREDVVEGRVMGGGRYPAKHVPVVRPANCLPRATHAE